MVNTRAQGILKLHLSGIISIVLWEGAAVSATSALVVSQPFTAFSIWEQEVGEPQKESRLASYSKTTFNSGGFSRYVL